MKPHLADALSLLRILALIPLAVFAAAGEWEAAFFTLGVAWATDLLDGLAARRFGSLRDRHPDFDADGIADSVLAFGASAIAGIYIAAHGGWAIKAAVIVLYLLTVVSGVAMVAIMNKEKARLGRWIIAGNMTVFHGLVQIAAVTIWFAYMAKGLSEAIAMAIVLLCIAGLQLRKMKLWWAGKFQ